MKTILLLIIATLGGLTVAYFFLPKSSTELTIGIIVPTQHVALDDIVEGFTTELTESLNRPVTVHVQNALGDINLQKSAINKFIADKVDLLVPVGKGASLMAMNLAPKDMPILFLAAFITEDSRDAESRPGLMGVIDEIPVDFQLKVMRYVLPDLKKFVVVAVSSDKIFDDVTQLVNAANAIGINVQKLMLNDISELYAVSSRIEQDNQAIFVLKDVVVASGINALVQQANTLKIPLITSDEGTIKKGGAFAVGVSERAIGRQGATIAKAFLDHEAQDKPIQYLREISVFVNEQACRAQGLDLAKINEVATTMNLRVVEG